MLRKAPPSIRPQLQRRLLWWAAGLAALGCTQCGPGNQGRTPAADHYISYQVNPRRQALRLYWQDEQGRPFRSVQRLREWATAHQQRLVFATNGGMYKAGNVPLGLLLEQGVVRTPLDTTQGVGNFYLKPNGVFYLTAEGKAGIVPTAAFPHVRRVRYATQSGPLLVLNGQIHPAFRANSTNLHIRNGVGILPDGTVLFAMSREKVRFYDMAAYFREQGCQTALYLDGFVSRTYLPEKQWVQTDGDFGVIIGVTEPAR
ncbi:phosphodiester glycosidase family protein [Hymenobacter sp. HSC-4F20]|uniref:phosphodiester glycosidase family protein n=1 Tax=Hymenobacter sp. HSC-4F20 TaxID=2864135 RepID=UPI001C72C31B|nr:phosphodiester glycosidase family protein [Hymenobacter sp. HSC-4F20]MBX0288868.1 phosphodiester glycosidase family protein [Hymenobacter sp. HSC-4F20]